MVDALCDEYGVFELPGRPQREYGNRTKEREFGEFFLNESDVEKALDAIEVCFSVINESVSGQEAIDELNARFKEHGVGYRFENGLITRIDSEFIHAEIVRPALSLLEGKLYAGAQEEFLKAHEHYRKGNYKEALNACSNAFESVMKSICTERGWDYSANRSGAAGLIGICFERQLIDEFWQSKFNALRSLLESSVPAARNKKSGHGQGPKPIDVPEHVVAYVLHMTASAIVFLAKANDRYS